VHVVAFLLEDARRYLEGGRLSLACRGKTNDIQVNIRASPTGMAQFNHDETPWLGVG
jgi:hypothetical protein